MLEAIILASSVTSFRSLSTDFFSVLPELPSRLNQNLVSLADFKACPK